MKKAHLIIFLFLIMGFLLISSVNAETREANKEYNYNATFLNVSMWVFSCHNNSDSNPPDNTLPPSCDFPLYNKQLWYSDIETSDNSYMCSGDTCTINATDHYTYLLYNLTMNESRANVTSMNWTWEGVKRSGADTVYVYQWNYSSSEWVQCGIQDTFSDIVISCNSSNATQFISSNNEARMLSKSDASSSSSHKVDYVKVDITYTAGQEVPTVAVTDDLSGTFYTDSILSVNVTPSDADLDTLSVNATWYVDGGINFSELKTGIASGTLTEFLLGSGNFSKGELVNVSFFANDGYNDSTLVWSSQINISNTAPTVTVTDDLSGTPDPDVDLDINVTPSDIDGDTLSVNVTWYVDGSIVFSELKSSIASGTLTQFILGEGNFSLAEKINATVFSNDGTDNSTLVWTSQVTTESNTAPNMSLVSPANNTAYSDSFTVTFGYTVSDAESEPSTCSLQINEIVEVTNLSITSGTSINYRKTMSYSTANYNWSVNCSDGVDMGTSGIFYFTTTDNQPSTPTGMSYSSDTSSITVSWSENSESDIEFYYLYMSLTETGLYSLQNYTSDTSYTLTGLGQGDDRWWKLSAKDLGGRYSENSSILFSRVAEGGETTGGGSGAGGAPPVTPPNIVECGLDIKQPKGRSAILKSKSLDDIHQNVGFTICNTNDVSITHTFYFEEALQNYCTLEHTSKIITGNNCYIGHYTCLTPPEPVTSRLIIVRNEYGDATTTIPLCESNIIVNVGKYSFFETWQTILGNLFWPMIIGIPLVLVILGYLGYAVMDELSAK